MLRRSLPQAQMLSLGGTRSPQRDRQSGAAVRRPPVRWRRRHELERNLHALGRQGRGPYLVQKVYGQVGVRRIVGGQFEAREFLVARYEAVSVPGQRKRPGAIQIRGGEALWQGLRG